MLQRGKVPLLGSGGSCWGARANIFGEDGGGGRQGEERWCDLGKEEQVEQKGEWEHCNLGEAERVERLDRKELGVAGGERLVSVQPAGSKERRCQ